VNDPLYVDEKIIDITGHHWGFYSGGYDGDHAVSTGEYREAYTWPFDDMWHRAYEEVFVTWVPGGGLGTGVEYYVNHGGGEFEAIVNQQDSPAGSVPDDPLAWQSLGVWDGVVDVRIIAPLLPSQPYEHVCADAVLLRGVDPICDLLTDSNNDGSITAEDDPIEGDPIGGLSAGPGRIVAIGSSTRTEVKLHAAAVDAVLSEPQDWWAQLRFPSGLKVWENPVGAPELTTNTTREITANAPWDTSVWIEGVTAGTASLQLELFSHPGDPEEERSYCWKDAVKFTVARIPIDLDVDTNRDGYVTDSDDPQEDEWTADHGAVILCNADDDNLDNVPDNWPGSNVVGDGSSIPADTVINTGDDLSDIGPLVMPRLGIADVPRLPGDLSLKFELESAPGEGAYWANIPPKDRVRIFLGTDTVGGDLFCEARNAELLGPTKGASVTFTSRASDPAREVSLFRGTCKIHFGIEGIYPGAPVVIKVTASLGTVVLGVDKVQVKVSPFIAFSHEALVAAGSASNPTVYVSEILQEDVNDDPDAPWNNNSDLWQTLYSMYWPSLELVPYADTSRDKWWQDPFEIGYAQAPYGKMHLILALPRSTTGTDPDLDFYHYARTTMIRNGVGLISYFSVGTGQRDCDDGGNFEVQPGWNSLGNPFGRIVMAQGPTTEPWDDGKMDQRVVSFLVAQGVQDVIDNIDLTWMYLGHIDEVVSFPTTANGRTRVASPEAAWALLRIAQEAGEGAQHILDMMNGLEYTGEYTTVDLALGNDDWRRTHFAPGGWSDRLLAVRNPLGLTSPITQDPTSGNGAPAGVLRRAGYLDVYDNLYTYDDEIQWRVQFTTDVDYTISYRKEDTEPWNADGTGSRNQDSLSNSRAVYILRDWWDSSLATSAGQTVAFRTKPSPDMIELPVLLCDARYAREDYSGAVACSNNVINCLVDGNTLVFADVKGPVVGGRDLFNWYVFQAADLVGFTGSIAACEERVYHNWFGSIHCGTNVLRQIPATYWWEQLA